MKEHHQFDRQKFKAAIQHVCLNPVAEDLGKIRLHKILYYADMLRFLETYRPLTGAEYQKQQFGPIAKHLSWALDELSREGKLEVSQVTSFGFPSSSFRALEQPPDGALTPEDKALLDEVTRFVCSHSARAISEISHNAAWDAVEIGDTIPYVSAFLLVPSEVTDEDVAWGDREAKRLFAA